MLGRLKKLFKPRRPTDVQYQQPAKDRPPVLPAAPPTTPFPPAAPLETPSADQTDRPS